MQLLRFNPIDHGKVDAGAEQPFQNSRGPDTPKILSTINEHELYMAARFEL